MEALRAGLRDLGAAFGPAPRPTTSGPAECARYGVSPPPGPAALVGVALLLSVPRDGVTVRLADAAETVRDQLYCPARAQPYALAAYAEPSPGLTLRIGHITPESEARIDSAVSFAFSPDTLLPGRLMPRPCPDDPRAWPDDPFGEPVWRRRRRDCATGYSVRSTGRRRLPGWTVFGSNWSRETSSPIA